MASRWRKHDRNYVRGNKKYGRRRLTWTRNDPRFSGKHLVSILEYLSQPLRRIAVSLESQLSGQPHGEADYSQKFEMSVLKVLHRDASGSIVQQCMGRPSSLLSEIVGNLERDVLRERVFDSGHSGWAAVSG